MSSARIVNARAAQRSADSYSGSLQALGAPRETSNNPVPAAAPQPSRVLSPTWGASCSDDSSIVESLRKRNTSDSDKSTASLRPSQNSADEQQRSQGASGCTEATPKMDAASSGLSAEGARDTVFRAWLDSLLLNFECYLHEVNSVDSAASCVSVRPGEEPGAYRDLLHEQRLRMQKLAKELMAVADSKDLKVSDATLRRSVPALSVPNRELQHLNRTNSESALFQSPVAAQPPPSGPPGRRLSIMEQARTFGPTMNRRMLDPRRLSLGQQPDTQPAPLPSLHAIHPVLSVITDVTEATEEIAPPLEHSFSQGSRVSTHSRVSNRSRVSNFSRSRKESWAAGKERASQQPRNVSARLDRQATAIIENTVGHEEVKNTKLPRMSLSSVVRVKQDIGSSIKRFVTSRSSMRKAISDVYFVAMMYSLVFTPIIVCLINPPSPAISVLEVMCEFVFMANVAAIFVCGTEDLETHKWVASLSKVIQNTPWLLTQMLVAVPWHLIWLIEGHTDVLLKLSMLRLLQLPKFISESVFGSSEAHLWSSSTLASVHPNLLRVVRLISLFFLMVHLIACGYYSVAAPRNGEWAEYAVEESASLPSKWTHAFYWALCGVLGENMDPIGEEEVSYNSACTAMGVMLNSCIVGSITSLIGNVDKRAAEQKAKIDTINAFMHKNGVTPDLCEQVRQYYKYLYASSSNAELLFEELSDSLRLKIDLCIHKKFIKQCHIFASCSPECIATLVTIISRNSSIFVPRELVFRKGDIGDAMYFVAKGEVMLYTPGTILDDNLINLEDLRNSQGPANQEGAERLAMARAGDFFGELALLMCDNVRSASAASMTFAELLCLPRLDFDRVLMWYPQFASSLQTTVWNQPSLEPQAPTEPPPLENPNAPDEPTPAQISPDSSWASQGLRPASRDPPKDGGVSEVCESNGAYAFPGGVESASLLPVS